MHFKECYRENETFWTVSYDVLLEITSDYYKNVYSKDEVTQALALPCKFILD